MRNNKAYENCNEIVSYNNNKTKKTKKREIDLYSCIRNGRHCVLGAFSPFIRIQWFGNGKFYYWKDKRNEEFGNKIWNKYNYKSKFIKMMLCV